MECSGPPKGGPEPFLSFIYRRSGAFGKKSRKVLWLVLAYRKLGIPFHKPFAPRVFGTLISETTKLDFV